MKLLVWIGIFATAALGVSAQGTSCAIYDGSLCNSVFGQANITFPSSITPISAVIAAQDILLGAQIEQFSAVQDQECLNYGIFLGCLILYQPCPGSAWCGANSKDELRSAVTSACRCDRADSCVVNSNGFNITAKDLLITLINSTLLSYYVGSSSTGPVGDSNAVCQDVTGVSAQGTSCAIYDGSLCSSVFGRANITFPSSITNISAFIAAQDISIGAAMEQFSAVVDQDCLDYGLFIACVGLYLPCPGSAWCGANSRDELRSAVSSACRCNRADSCVVNLNGSMVTAEDGLIALINRSLPNYYVGSSSTGPVGDSNAVCQDVTFSGSIGNMKVSLMSIALVAISFSARLWLL